MQIVHDITVYQAASCLEHQLAIILSKFHMRYICIRIATLYS